MPADLDLLTASSAEEPTEIRKDRPPPTAGRLDDPTATGDTAIAIALVAVGVWGKARVWPANLQLGPSRLSGGKHSSTLPAGRPRNGQTEDYDSGLVPPLRGGGRQAGYPRPPGPPAARSTNRQKPAGSDRRQHRAVHRPGRQPLEV